MFVFGWFRGCSPGRGLWCRKTEYDFIGHYFSRRQLRANNAGTIAFLHCGLVYCLLIQFELRLARILHRDGIGLCFELKTIELTVTTSPVTALSP